MARERGVKGFTKLSKSELAELIFQICSFWREKDIIRITYSKGICYSEITHYSLVGTSVGICGTTSVVVSGGVGTFATFSYLFRFVFPNAILVG